MDFLGVGPMELFFILILALVVLGPRDMAKAGRTLGRALNKLVRSPTWSAMKQTTQAMRTLPTQLMREANLEESMKEINQVSRDINSTTTELARSIGGAQKSLDQAADAPRQAADEVQSSLKAWTEAPPSATPAQETPAASFNAWITPPAQDTPSEGQETAADQESATDNPTDTTS